MPRGNLVVGLAGMMILFMPCMSQDQAHHEGVDTTDLSEAKSLNFLHFTDIHLDTKYRVRTCSASRDIVMM